MRKNNKKYVSIFPVIFTFGGFVLLIYFFQTRNPALNVDKQEIWNYIEEAAGKFNIDPNFTFAIARAESNLNSLAHKDDARGIMQITPEIWKLFTNVPFDKAWDWKLNIIIGLRYIHTCKIYLERSKKFSYPLLAACYRFGPDKVREANFDLNNLPEVENKVYQELFQGEFLRNPNN